jgi:bile acid:Na+ symporter, BASS family
LKLQDLVELILRVSIVLNVFAIGLEARFADPVYLFRRPGKLVRAFISMDVVMPVVALLLVFNFDLDPAVKIALLALSVSPVPPLFPKRALWAEGKENYTIGLVVATAFLAIPVIPLAMVIFERISGKPLSMSAGSVARIVFIMILVPLLLGIAARTSSDSFAQRVRKYVGPFASWLLILSALPVLFVEARPIYSLFGNGTVLSLTVFTLTGLIAGYWLGGPEPLHRRVLAFGTAGRHPGLAIAIAHGNFPQQKMVVPAVCLYLVISILLSVLFYLLVRKAGGASSQAKQQAAA